MAFVAPKRRPPSRRMSMGFLACSAFILRYLLTYDVPATPKSHVSPVPPPYFYHSPYMIMDGTRHPFKSQGDSKGGGDSAAVLGAPFFRKSQPSSQLPLLATPERYPFAWPILFLYALFHICLNTCSGANGEKRKVGRWHLFTSLDMVLLLRLWLVCVLARVPVATALHSVGTATLSSTYIASPEAKKTMPAGSDHPPTPASMAFSRMESSLFSSPPSSSCAEKLLTLEARADRLEKELVISGARTKDTFERLKQEVAGKTKELDFKNKELDEERQQRQAAEVLLQQCEGCAQRTVLKEDGNYDVGTAAKWLLVGREKLSDGSSRNLGNGQVDDVASKAAALKTRSLFETNGGLLTGRRMTTMTTVSSEGALTSALVSDALIEFSENIQLQNTVVINALVKLFVDGNGFKLDGNNAVRCLYIWNNAEVTLTNIMITGGSTSMFEDGGGLFIDFFASVTMELCLVAANAGGKGAGLAVKASSDLRMKLCIIYGNTAFYDGGGVYIDMTSTVRMDSCHITSNSAAGWTGDNAGGGIYIDSDIISNGATLYLVGCTFDANSAQTGGDIYQAPGSTLDLFSLCPDEGTVYAGTGSLNCAGCSGPSDLSNSTCAPCPTGALFACCGARECSASAQTCSDMENEMCINIPPFFFNPSNKPTPLPTTIRPTLLPSLLPSELPTQLPTPIPTNKPTLLPTMHPTLLPTLLPTNSPTPFPTLSPTVYCGAGYYLNKDFGTCTVCSVGKFTNTSRAPFPTKCQTCVAGTYAKEQGMAECEICPQGKLSSPGRSFCEDCSAGEYIKDAKECAACENGRYAPQPLTGACLACGAGSFTNNGSSATTCSPCNAGSFSTELTAVACTFCAVGRASVSGQKSCSPCEPGKYAGFQGSSTCTACSAGFAVATEGASRCNECTAGRSQSRASQLFCELCPGGEFSSQSASTICSECPRGYSSAGGSSSCDGQTDEGYFLYQGVATGCPKNSACNGGTLMPRPNTGYWVDRNSLDYVHVIYKCPRKTCVSHESQTTTNQRNLAGDDDGWSCWTMAAYSDDGSNDGSPCNSDNLLCKEGSRGVLCGSCDDGYIFSSAERLCTQCHMKRAVALSIAGVVVLLSGLFVASQYVQVVPSCVERSWVWGLLRQLDSGDLRVAWANYQIIQSSSWNLDLEYPSPFKEMLNVLSIFSLDFLSLDCLFENSDHLLSVYVWSAVPIILAALIVLVHVAEGAFSWKVGNPCPKTATLTYRLLLLCYLVLPPVTFKQLQALDCVTVAGGSFLRIDTSIDCHSRLGGENMKEKRSHWHPSKHPKQAVHSVQKGHFLSYFCFYGVKTNPSKKNNIFY